MALLHHEFTWKGGLIRLGGGDLMDLFDLLDPTPDQRQRMLVVREAFCECADTLMQNVPDGPDRDHLLRGMRECALWANVAICKNPDGTPRR